MNDNAENIKKDIEENKELLNLSDEESRRYEAAFEVIENRPVNSSLPAVQIVLVAIVTVSLIIGIIQIAS